MLRRVRGREKSESDPESLPRRRRLEERVAPVVAPVVAPGVAPVEAPVLSPEKMPEVTPVVVSVEAPVVIELRRLVASLVLVEDVGVVLDCCGFVVEDEGAVLLVGEGVGAMI